MAAFCWWLVSRPTGRMRSHVGRAFCDFVMFAVLRRCATTFLFWSLPGPHMSWGPSTPRRQAEYGTPSCIMFGPSLVRCNNHTNASGGSEARVVRDAPSNSSAVRCASAGKQRGSSWERESVLCSSLVRSFARAMCNGVRRGWLPHQYLLVGLTMGKGPPHLLRSGGRVRCNHLRGPARLAHQF